MPRRSSGPVSSSPVRSVAVPTQTHGRVLIEDPADAPAVGTLVAFHGYGSSAEDMIEEVLRIPGVSRWRVASVQALHRFYTRGDRKVVASWMTRQDRDLAIADNVDYVDHVVHGLVGEDEIGPRRLVYVGFSQGASMAYRAAVLGDHMPAGVIALGGDIPPELKEPRVPPLKWPPVLVGAGSRDEWFASKVDADVAFLEAERVTHQVVRFEGGHEWTQAFCAAAGEWLGHL